MFLFTVYLVLGSGSPAAFQSSGSIMGNLSHRFSLEQASDSDHRPDKWRQGYSIWRLSLWGAIVDIRNIYFIIYCWQQNKNNNPNIHIMDIYYFCMYFADEVVFVLAPHVAVSGDVNDHSFKRAQCPFLWLDQERYTFPMSEKSTHKICAREQKSSYWVSLFCFVFFYMLRCRLFCRASTHLHILFLLFSLIA